MIPCIRLFSFIRLSHVLVSILCTQSSSSLPTSNTVSLIHHHVHFFALLGCLNPVDFAIGCWHAALTLVVDVHRVRYFRVDSSHALITLINLLEVVVNVYLRAASLVLNMLVKFHHLWLFLMELVNYFLSDLISKELIVLQVSVHILQFLLNQLIFHYSTNLVLLANVLIMLGMASL